VEIEGDELCKDTLKTLICEYLRIKLEEKHKEQVKMLNYQAKRQIKKGKEGENVEERINKWAS